LEQPLRRLLGTDNPRAIFQSACAGTRRPELLATRGKTMALIKCPDCENNVSDSAPTCPHCGRPIDATGSAAPMTLFTKFLWVLVALVCIGLAGSWLYGQEQAFVKKNAPSTSDTLANTPAQTQRTQPSPTLSNDQIPPAPPSIIGTENLAPPTAALPASTTITPQYDTAAYCRKIGDTVGGSNDIELTCRRQESGAENWVRSRNTPDRTMRYCARIGETVGGSYDILKTCIQQEEEAASQL